MIYFVTENYLKTYTSVTQNVDATDLLPIMKTAAEMSVKSLLGTFFFDDLLVKYNAQTLDPDETILVELMQPVIAWKAASDATFELGFQVKNKGPQTQSGDFSDSPDFKSVSFNFHHKLQKSEYYQNGLIKFLTKNKDLYSVFLSDDNYDSSLKDCDPDNDTTQNTNILFI